MTDKSDLKKRADNLLDTFNPAKEQFTWFDPTRTDTAETQRALKTADRWSGKSENAETIKRSIRQYSDPDELIFDEQPECLGGWMYEKPHRSSPTGFRQYGLSMGYRFDETPHVPVDIEKMLRYRNLAERGALGMASLAVVQATLNHDVEEMVFSASRNQERSGGMFGKEKFGSHDDNRRILKNLGAVDTSDIDKNIRKALVHMQGDPDLTTMLFKREAVKILKDLGERLLQKIADYKEGGDLSDGLIKTGGADLYVPRKPLIEVNFNNSLVNFNPFSR